MKKELFLKIADKVFDETKDKDFIDVLSEMEKRISLIWTKEFYDFNKKVKSKVKTLPNVKHYFNEDDFLIQVVWSVWYKKDTAQFSEFVNMITEHNKKEPVCKLQYTRNDDKGIYDIVIEPA